MLRDEFNPNIFVKWQPLNSCLNDSLGYIYFSPHWMKIRRITSFCNFSSTGYEFGLHNLRSSLDGFVSVGSNQNNLAYYLGVKVWLDNN